MIITTSLVYAALALFTLISNPSTFHHHFPKSIKATLSTFAPSLLPGYDHLDRLWLHFPYLKPLTQAPTKVFVPLAFPPQLFETQAFQWCDASSAPPPAATRVFNVLFGSKTVIDPNVTISLQVLAAILGFLCVLSILGGFFTRSRVAIRLSVDQELFMIDTLDIEPCKLPPSVSTCSVLEEDSAPTVSTSTSTLSASDSFTTAVLIPSVSLQVSDSTDSFLSYVDPADPGPIPSSQSVRPSTSIPESISSYASIVSLANSSPVTPTTPTPDPYPWIEVRSRSPTPVATPPPTPKAPTTQADSFRNSFSALQDIAQEDNGAQPSPPPSRAPARTETRNARGKSNKRQAEASRPAPPPARPAQQRGINTRQKRQDKRKPDPKPARAPQAPQTRKDVGTSTQGPSTRVLGTIESTCRSATNTGDEDAFISTFGPFCASQAAASLPRSSPHADVNTNRPPSSQEANVRRSFSAVLTSEPSRPMHILSSTPTPIPQPFFTPVPRRRSIADALKSADMWNERTKQIKRCQDENRPISPELHKGTMQRGPGARRQRETNKAALKEGSVFFFHASLPKTSPNGFVVVGNETHRIQDCDRPKKKSSDTQQQASSSGKKPRPIPTTDSELLTITGQPRMSSQRERKRQQRVIAALLECREQGSNVPIRASLVGVGYAVRPKQKNGEQDESA
ncbi:hypothetical protein EIP86_003325 [Pleurotus ostreatoroseus]|nr:hypothetical protein EIP86_003325 [Pleurotus ostreatoroseus]